jgi:hypothetical protein
MLECHAFGIIDFKPSTSFVRRLELDRLAVAGIVDPNSFSWLWLAHLRPCASASSARSRVWLSWPDGHAGVTAQCRRVAGPEVAHAVDQRLDQRQRYPQAPDLVGRRQMRMQTVMVAHVMVGTVIPDAESVNRRNVGTWWVHGVFVSITKRKIPFYNQWLATQC